MHFFCWGENLKSTFELAVSWSAIRDVIQQDCTLPELGTSVDFIRGGSGAPSESMR